MVSGIIILVVAGIFFLIGCGIYGVIAVERKMPIVNPNGNTLVTVVYAMLWALAFIGALYISSSVIHIFFSKVGEPSAVFRDPLMHDMQQFFFKSTFILFISARTSTSRLARANVSLERAIICMVAFAVLSPGFPATSLGSQWTWPAELITHFWEGVMFPLQALQTIREEGLWTPFYRWLEGNGGNLFRLSPLVGKLFLVFAAIKWYEVLFKRKGTVRFLERRPLGQEEISNLQLALLYTACLLVCVGITYYLPGTEFAWWKPLLVLLALLGIPAALGILIMTLFVSRETYSRPEVKE